MSSNSDHYHFVTNWRVRGTVDQVAALLSDVTDLPRWWPSVYREATKLADGHQSGQGDTYEVVTQGWMPYSLRWRMKISATQSPVGFTINATGDLVGIGVCTIVQHDGFVDVAFDWEVVVRKWIVRLLSSVTRPLIATNHRWAMSRGQMSLERELLARAAHTESEREAIAPPPGPIQAASVWATFGLVLVSLVLPGSILMRILKNKSERDDRQP